MMSNVSMSAPSSKEGVRATLALLLLAGGLFLCWFLSGRPMLLRGGLLLAGLVSGAFVAMRSGFLRKAFEFVKESFAEVSRVTWPSRRETVQVTIAVFGFVLAMAVFLSLVDKVLQWAMYDLLLGWGR